MGVDREYVFGVNDRELARLEYQHCIFADVTTELWKQCGYAPGQTVVELGAGPGFATRDLAAWMGRGGRVVALDVSAKYLEANRVLNGHGRTASVSWHACDVDELAWSEAGVAPGSADHVFGRWVFSFLQRPEHVIAEAAGALRAGGTLSVIDYFNFGTVRMCPEGPAFHKAYDAMLTNWRNHGATPDIGRVLPAMMSEGGFAIERVDPLMLIARPGTALWNWPRLFFEGQLDILVDAGLLASSDRDAWYSEWDRLTASPGTFFSIPGMVRIVGRRR